MPTALPILILALGLAVVPPAPGASDTGRSWRQGVRYTIMAGLDEPSGTLLGTAVLDYRNNSPDTLGELYFHLYLNAFRPRSLWSSDETREGVRRFADLPDPYHAFERLRRVSVAGTDVEPEFPHAPDSTVARIPLPGRLAPGDSVRVVMLYSARPSVVPRRQGRRGRRFDFAQWYPQIAVYDRHGWAARPLRRAGEFYGEFATYDVTLDLAEDQVVAATGVAVEGDPGFGSARATAATPVSMQREWYPGVPPGPWSEAPARGRKRVRFYAEDVHNFAWSANPQYVYEEGAYRDVVIRVLYLPEDRATWGGGRVLERATRALAWLDTIFGTYPWPHVTIVHRIEGGGTEFPMLVMNGGPEESLVFHELGHLYTFGLLANNEWREGWLDEGFATFTTAWNFHRRGMGVPSQRTQQLILGTFDLDGWSEPVATVAEDFSEFGIYNRMIYTKGQLVLEMLRYVLGEETFRRGLREYYARHRLRHVDEEALRRTMEDVSGQDLGWFFGQWLHATPLVDYRLRKVDRRRLADGTWRTAVTVERVGDALMPVDVAIPARDSTHTVRVSGQSRVRTVEVATASRPGRVELDPQRQTLDWNYMNNRERRRPLGLGPAWGPTAAEHRFGWSGSEPARRDRPVVNWLPLAWYGDAGGWTFGLQARSNYMGRFERHVLQLGWATGESAGRRLQAHAVVRNPVAAHAPRRQVAAEAWYLDGVGGGRLRAEWDRSGNLTFGPRTTAGLELLAMSVDRSAYLDRSEWDAVTTGEATAWWRRTWGRSGEPTTTVRFTGTAGVAADPAPVRPLLASATVDVWPYARWSAEAGHSRDVRSARLRVRAVLAGTKVRSGFDIPRQRALNLGGADPYATFMNPFLRSRGALLARGDVHYHAPGIADSRGLARIGSDRALALNGEFSRPLVRRPARRVFNSLSATAFADLILARESGDTSTFLPSGFVVTGFGIVASHRIGPTNFVTRFDVPFFASPARAAIGVTSGERRVALRWRWSLEEAF